MEEFVFQSPSATIACFLAVIGNVVYVLCVFVYLKVDVFFFVFIRRLMESDFPMQGLTFTNSI